MRMRFSKIKGSMRGKLNPMSFHEVEASEAAQRLQEAKTSYGPILIRSRCHGLS